MEFVMRLAAETDAGGILAVYAPYVAGTPITFETDIPDAGEMARRIRETSARYPYIVCLLEGRIAGYAYAHQLRERAAYAWDAELSVYVDRERHHQGIGRALYAALMDILKLQNVQNVYGCVTVPNPGSERLHDAFGFRRLGEFQKTGYKLGAWRDVAWFEKFIGGHEPEPKPFLPVTEVGKGVISGILGRYTETLMAACARPDPRR